MRAFGGKLSIAVVLASGLGLAAAHAAETTTQPRPLFRHPDVETAWTAVHETGRPLFIFVTRKDCPYCEKMLAETLAHRKLTPALRQQFETVQFTAEERPDLIKHFAIRLCPTVLVVSAEGEFLARIEGFTDPKKFVATVRPALAKYAASQQAVAERPIRQVR